MSNRRKSLGPLSTNRRVSLASGYDVHSKQSSAAAGTRSRSQRKSMAPRVSYSSSSPPHHGNRRKSDVMNSRYSTIPPPTSAKIDQRPIGDKAYFNSCIKKMYTFLQNNEYEYSIKLKDLSRPSAKDFTNIMTFLLRKVDPNFQSSSGNGNVTGRVHGSTSKFEDEVSMAFRNLGYPFNISKTALVAAGSPHTWPTLLLAMTWLIELLELTQGEDEYLDSLKGDGLDPKNEAGAPMSSQAALEERTDKAFLRYTEMSYGSFLNGDDEQFELLEKGMLDYFERDNMIIEQEFEKITEINAGILGQIEDFGKEVEDLPERHNRLESLAMDVEKFHALVEQLNEHKASLQTKVEEYTVELARKEELMAKKEARITELKHIIDTQEYSQDDINQLEREKRKLEEEVNMAIDARMKHEEITLKSAIDLEKRFRELREVVEEFNGKVESMGLHKSLENSALLISIQKEKAHEMDQSLLLGGVNLKSEVMPILSTMAGDYSEKARTLRKRLIELSSKQEEMENAIAEMNEEIKNMVSKIRYASETLSTLEHDQKVQCKAKEEEYQSLKEKVATICDPSVLEDTIAQYKKQVKDLEAVSKKQQEENIVRKQAFLEELNTAMISLEEFLNHKRIQLDNFDSKVKNSKQDVITLSEADQALLLLS